VSETLLLAPNRNWALFAAVSDGSPTAADPDHELAWATDGRPGFPLRLNSGSGVITLTKTAGEVDLVALGHHLLPEALSVAISGDVSGSIVIPDYPSNGVPYNAWTRIGGSPLGSPAEVDTLILTISQGSPADDIVIGEVFAGVPLVLDPSLKRDTTRFGVRRYMNARSGNELSGVPPYSERARSRPITGSQYYDEAMVQALLDAFDSQDAYAYPVPCLLILDSDDPTDARVVTMEEPVITPPGPSGSEVEFLVELTFNEVPRTRW
jgi:hypothetical protein